ncbi:hypothetical protein OBK01_12425 [Empedobacter falsenii]|uniref:Uncharacterized protein n=1 Tax=Empedobacter stercoris TaxID=1628248 RepID=A0ABX1WLL8_9FLAO|nr:hypothetical protein [Empedobacter stercoris]NOJ75388.1 hypothetical protein [Empedobacter stercoris]
MINRYFNPIKNKLLKNEIESYKDKSIDYHEKKIIVNTIFQNKELRFYMSPFNFGTRYYNEQYERVIQHLLFEEKIESEKKYLINSISCFSNEISRLENLNEVDIKEFHSILEINYNKDLSKSKIKGFIDEYIYILKYLKAKLLRIDPTYIEKKVEVLTNEEKYLILKEVFKLEPILSKLDLNVTQKQILLGELIGVSDKTIRNYEKSISNKTHLEKLEKANNYIKELKNKTISR